MRPLSGPRFLLEPVTLTVTVTLVLVLTYWSCPAAAVTKDDQAAAPNTSMP